MHTPLPPGSVNSAHFEKNCPVMHYSVADNYSVHGPLQHKQIGFTSPAAQGAADNLKIPLFVQK